MMVSEFAKTIDDPSIREAIALQGVEETRHGRLMEYFVDRYEIPIGPVDMVQPAPTREEFIEFGYEECLDAFLGFGLFGIARGKPDFMPPALLDVFQNILLEEARHTTFFINWIRYEEARAGRDGYVVRTPRTVANYVRSLRRLIASFSGDVNASGFIASGATDVIADVTPQMFLETAIREHRRYMGMLDPRLKKPALLPTLAGVALTALRALPPREHAAPASTLHAADIRTAA